MLTFPQALNNLSDAYEVALRAANRSDEYADLSGERGVARGRLASATRRHLRETINVLRHRCQYNDDDYCRICGRDGRA